MVNHGDLMARINNGTDTPPDLIEDHDEQGNEWRDVDIRAGHSRVEATVSTKVISRIFKKLFGRS
jgi:hypothetical protein